MPSHIDLAFVASLRLSMRSDRPSTITQATLRSDNTVYARLTLDLGPENVVRLAHRMGITTMLEPVASVGLGSNSVGVLEMADAYATIAAGGTARSASQIR